MGNGRAKKCSKNRALQGLLAAQHPTMRQVAARNRRIAKTMARIREDLEKNRKRAALIGKDVA